jgi:hypothetical protein
MGVQPRIGPLLAGDLVKEEQAVGSKRRRVLDLTGLDHGGELRGRDLGGPQVLLLNRTPRRSCSQVGRDKHMEALAAVAVRPIQAAKVAHRGGPQPGLLFQLTGGKGRGIDVGAAFPGALGNSQ